MPQPMINVVAECYSDILEKRTNTTADNVMYALTNIITGIKQGEFQELEKQIKQLLQANAMPVSELLNQLNSNREKAEKVLSYLLSEEIIQLKNGILSV